MHKELLIDKFLDVVECVALVQKRFEEIQSPDDFVITPRGIEIMDSIAMRLQVIGEIIAKINKTESVLLSKHQDVKWNDIIGMRNIISLLKHVNIICRFSKKQ